MWDNSAFNHNPNISLGRRITDRNWMRSALPRPLRATCHRSSGRWSRSSPLPPAIWVCTPDVWYGHLQPFKWLTLCVNVHVSVSVCVCVCVWCLSFFLSSSLCCLPLAGHHTDSGTSSHLHPLRRDLKITTQAVVFFCTRVNLAGVRCRPQESRSRRTAINHSRMLRPQPAGTPRS